VSHEDAASFYVQLGAIVFVLAFGARLAGRLGLSPVPLYLLAGLLVGSFDIPALSGEFIGFAAELGVILLLFLIGLEYTAEELRAHLRRFRGMAALDAVLNFAPGLAAGLLLGWDWEAAILLGGITWISSSSIVYKSLGDLGWMRNRETPAIVSVLVAEDLAMAVFIPFVAALLVGGSVLASIGSLAVAAAAATAALVGAIRFGESLERIVAHTSEEVVLLSALGVVLIVAGIAEHLQVSAAVGAFLVGIALSGEIAHRTQTLLSPIRDFNAALFFLFFGLQIDTSQLSGVVVPVAVLVVVSAATKVIVGWRAAGLVGAGRAGRARAAVALIPRGEMSIVLASLGAGAASQLQPLAAGYVLVLAIAGPVLMRLSPEPEDAAAPARAALHEGLPGAAPGLDAKA
jgi:CPA2 family monovalent cation:H+ antiporter-2